MKRIFKIITEQFYRFTYMAFGFEISRKSVV